LNIIRLPRGEWSYDPSHALGPEGGFGIVYAGEGKDSGPVKPDQDYRWHEVSYFVNPMARSARGQHECAPFALTDDVQHADEATGPALTIYCKAWGPEPIDDENAEAFCDRWAALLAKAAQGQLTYPRTLPLS
jgi:hypothetical protein